MRAHVSHPESMGGGACHFEASHSGNGFCIVVMPLLRTLTDTDVHLGVAKLLRARHLVYYGNYDRQVLCPVFGGFCCLEPIAAAKLSPGAASIRLAIFRLVSPSCATVSKTCLL